MAASRLDEASFRDPDSQVVHLDGRVLRRLSETGTSDWEALSASTFFERAVTSGRLVGTVSTPVDHPALGDGWATVVEHERVPFITYPFEWTFGMLADAAVLHLELLRDALRESLTTKDGYAYNLQWRGVDPVFIDKLLEAVRELSWRPPASLWTSSAATNTYTAGDRARKRAFVEKVASRLRPRLVWDLGCNDGTYTRAVAQHATHVVAMDADHATVELLYRSLRADRVPNVVPLVVDLADPSPALGWRNRERPALLERARPDLVVCLALVHHLAISANIPLPRVVEWLAALADVVVIEFAERRDPMVAQLLANKSVTHADYSLVRFEQEVAKHFDTEAREELSCGTRTLYALRRR